jgi:hypothetical protein
MQLGLIKTKIPNSGNPPQYEARPWSIVLKSKAGKGSIYHYGPTGEEKD